MNVSQNSPVASCKLSSIAYTTSKVIPYISDTSACAARGGVARQIDSSAFLHHRETTIDYAKGQTSH